MHLSPLPEKRKLIYFPKEHRRTYWESCIAPSGTLLDLNGVFHMQPSTPASAAPQDINTPSMHSLKTYVISMELISLYKHGHSLEGQ